LGHFSFWLDFGVEPPPYAQTGEYQRAFAMLVLVLGAVTAFVKIVRREE